MIQTRNLPCGDLIPYELQGEVLCLKAEDHYLRVYSTAGEALVLFRFSDAVKALPKEAGLQVHRSYWVSRSALLKTPRRGQRQYLELTNGLTLPVSRSHVPELRDAGWLVSSPRSSTIRHSLIHRLTPSWMRNSGLTKWGLAPKSWRHPALSAATLCIGILIGTNLITPSGKTPVSNTQAVAEAAFASGWREYLQDTPQSFTRAAKHFQQAVAMDEDLGKAYGALASLYHSAAVRGWNRQMGQRLHVTYRLAHQNLISAARHPSAEGHAAEAQALLYRRRVEEAMVESARAIAIDPKNPAGHLWMANSLIMAGLAEQAEGFLDKAKSLGHPSSPSTLWARGMAAFVRQDFNAAANHFEQSIEQSPAMNAMPLVAVYGHLGRQQDAAEIIEHERAQRTVINPLNLVTVMDGMIFRRKVDAKRFVTGLKLAGL
jgi:tetratricopeptide (TPR) repeat protein